MAFRFRRRVKLAPGLYLNASARGIGLSLGPRGSSVTWGPRGTYVNSSIPGTGLYSRQKVGSSTQISSRAVRESMKRQQLQQELSLLMQLEKTGFVTKFNKEDGPIRLCDREGAPLPSTTTEALWKHMRDSILEQIQDALESQSREIQELGRIHLSTPSPDRAPEFIEEPFSESEPPLPISIEYHWFKQIFSSHRRHIDVLNLGVIAEHKAALIAHQKRRETHERRLSGCRRMFDIRNLRTSTAVEGFLSWHFEHLKWPQETEVCFELSEDGTALVLDIDLPEIEDFPEGHHVLLPKIKETRWKKFTDTARRTLYMNYVHGVGLRLAGETFAHAQGIQVVVASAYSQRANRQTGAIENQYLYSSRMTRQAWSRIQFDNLERLDPVVSFPVKATVQNQSFWRVERIRSA